MDNDLNTALALTALYDVLKAKTNDRTKRALVEDFDTVLSLSLAEAAAKIREQTKAAEAAKSTQSAADSLAVVCLSPSADDALKAEVEALIRERAEAKKAKNFALADEIRGRLSGMGVSLKDGRNTVEWTVG